MAKASSAYELVLRWQELRDQGQTVSAEELCAGCPELLDDLKRQLQALASMEGLLGASGSEPPTAASATPPELADRTETRPAGPLGEGGAAVVGARYRPLRLHARGGLGEVYLAQDEELSREVALKRMRQPQADDAGSRRRFLREGEITGSLEHPGVVPVYGLTRDADGQPCYAMRFIRGQTLQEVIARFHATAEAGRALALRQLLGRFVAVCNTIAYAHSCGVVHRDLKPPNIMLGDYGETLVVDWGLAKRVGVSGKAGPPGQGNGLPHAPADSREDGTAAGDVLGTPAFMSPEQAAGRHDAVGPASDVYGLGATLYALLTGGPPFARDRVGAVLSKVQRGDFLPPRQLRPNTPRALEAICLKAMAREPAARYATALELAADLERWLADEPVNAYPEPLRLRVGRWARRHRAAIRAAMAVALMAVALAGIGAWWLERQQAEKRRGVEGALAEVGRLQGQAKWPEARAVLNQAQDRLGNGGPEDLRRQLEKARADLKMVERLDELRQHRASRVATDDFISPRAVADAFRKAFRDGGLAVDGEADRLLEEIRASAIREELVDALDEWAWFTPDPDEQARLLTVARQAGPHPWRDRFRDPVVRKDGRALKQLAAEAPLADLSPILLMTFAAALGRTGGDQEGVLRQAQQMYPGDFWINFDLALLLSNRAQQGEAARTDLAEANGFDRAALATRPRSSLAWTNLSGNLGKQGKFAAAEAAARKAIRLQGDNGLAHLNLSMYLNRQRRYAEAEAVCQDFIQRIRSDYHRIYHNLSFALEHTGDLKGAKAACDKAIKLKPGYALAWSRRGSVSFQQENYSEAERDFREAFRLDPELAGALIDVVNSLRPQKKLVEAEAFCRDVMRTRPKYAPAYLGLASIRFDQGKLADAEAECRKAIRLWPDYALACSSLGVILLDQQKVSEALAAHRKAVSLAPDDSGILINCAASLREDGALDEAEPLCREAIKIRPKWGNAHFHLGLVQLRQGMVCPVQFRQEKFHQAEISFRKAVELQPGLGRHHVRLGDALKWQGRFTAALKAYRRGDELGRKEPRWASYIKDRVPEAQQLVEVETQLASGLKGVAKSSKHPAPLTVAQLYVYKRHYAAAARFYAKAFTAQPKLAEDGNGHRYDAACCAVLASGGQGEDAAKLDDMERAGWRSQGLDWLRGEVKRWTKQMAGATATDRTRLTLSLQNWRRDSDLAKVRDEKALAKLPDAERAAWQQLWADVDALLKRAEGAE